MKLAPTSRLLILSAAMMFPSAALVTYMPASAPLCLVVLGMWLILAAGDGLMSKHRLDSFDITFPDVIRLTRGRASQIEILIDRVDTSITRLKIGLALPADIYSEDTECDVVLPSEATPAIVAWPCIALRQGRYNLHHCYLEVSSALGLWTLRGADAVESEIRAYPNLISERQNLSALFLNHQLGAHSQRQIGKGRDFEQLREYSSGDSYEDIYWKATAKRGYPVTKIFQVERTQDVYIIIDGSRLSGRVVANVEPAQVDRQLHAQDQHETIFDRYVSAALIMGLAAERQGDHFGVITFSDQVRGFIRAKNGKAHYNACRDMLFTLQPERVTPDFSEIFAFIGTRIRKRALLVFLTNLDDPVISETFIHNIRLVSKRHVVLVNMVNASDAKPLFTSGDVSSPDDVYVALAEHLIWENLRETKKILSRQDARFALFDNENMCPHLVSQYMNIKQRQIL